MKVIEGNIVDIINKKIFPGKIEYDNKIINIEPVDKTYNSYIVPGFVDSHIHIESSMLVPSEFAKIAVKHGTIATVSDPHEIANVLGIDGVKFMIENGKSVPFKFYFGVPSCVPATVFETAGGKIDEKDAEELFKNENLLFLSEMMNVPGVLYKNDNVFSMINTAKKYNSKIDGHAPGLTGENLKTYIEAGITTDHEAITYEEGLEKIKNGMKIQIREGSAAKNFEALVNLIKTYPDSCMFCSDDLHPDDLVKGHINISVKKAISKGIDIFDVLKAAVLNPKRHYGLDVGLLQMEDDADFIIVNNLKDFEIEKTVINGKTVFENGNVLIQTEKSKIINNFNIGTISNEDIKVYTKNKKFDIIQVIDGQLITEKETFEFSTNKESDVENDILKIVVVNRYNKAKPAVAFIKGFGFKNGAIASSVAHDSHNIISIGTNDNDICKSINLITENKGGISAVFQDEIIVLPLPIAGIMSNKDGYKAANLYQKADSLVKENGCNLSAPYMTMSFMALLVIPSIKISDKGLFDSDKFEFINP